MSALKRVLLALAIGFAVCAPAFARTDIIYGPIKAVPAEAAPQLIFLDPKGEEVTVDDKPVLRIVHFWATWCVPCVIEMPELDKVQLQYRDAGLSVLALSMDGIRNAEKVQQFLPAHGLRMAPFFDDKNRLFFAFQGVGLPTSLFIDAKGKLIARADGPVDWNSPDTQALLQRFTTPAAR